jgi:hypothetical protein
MAVDSAAGLELRDPWSAVEVEGAAVAVAVAVASSSSARELRLRLTSFFLEGFLKEAISS